MADPMPVTVSSHLADLSSIHHFFTYLYKSTTIPTTGGQPPITTTVHRRDLRHRQCRSASARRSYTHLHAAAGLGIRACDQGSLQPATHIQSVQSSSPAPGTTPIAKTRPLHVVSQCLYRISIARVAGTPKPPSILRSLVRGLLKA